MQAVVTDAIAFIDDLEGAGAEGYGLECQHLIMEKLDDADGAVVRWCKERLGKDLEQHEAYSEVFDWCEKEDVPLKGKYQKLLQELIDKNGFRGGDDAWAYELHAARAMFALAKKLDDEICSRLEELADYVYPDDLEGLPNITGVQFLEAAKQVIEKSAKAVVEKEGIQSIFLDAIHDYGILNNRDEIILNYVADDAEKSIELINTFLNDDCSWEIDTWLCDEKWYSKLLPAISVRADGILETVCSEWEEDRDTVLAELPPLVSKALKKGLGLESDDTNAEAEVESLTAVSPTPLEGAALLSRLDELQRAGVAFPEIIKRCGYFRDGEDYSAANMKFFDAKIAASKQTGIELTNYTSAPAPETDEDNDADETDEQVKNILDENEGYDEFNQALAHYVLDGGIGEKTKEGLLKIKKKHALDEISDDDYLCIAKEYIQEYIANNDDWNINSEYFNFIHLYFAGWNLDDREIALKMLEFTNKHPECKHLLRQFAAFMTNNTECGMENSAYLSFSEPFWSSIKEFQDELPCFTVEILLTGSESKTINTSDFVGDFADFLENPEQVQILKELGYTIVPRDKEELKRLAEQKKAEEQAKKQERIEAKQAFEISEDLEADMEIALGECYFEPIFQKAEKYKQQILLNIQEIAENFNAENEFTSTGNEPEWLLQALREAGAAIEGEELTAAQFISRTLDALPDASPGDYFRITMFYGAESIAWTKGEIKSSLETTFEIEGFCNEELPKVSYVKLDTINNVTIWVYDNEFGSLAKPDVITLNTLDDAETYCEWNSAGGHLALIKLITRSGDTETVQLGEETDIICGHESSTKEDYRSILYQPEDYPKMVAAVGGPEVVERMQDYDDIAPIKEAVRAGKFPVLENSRLSSRKEKPEPSQSKSGGSQEQTETAESFFKGKHICITGKLEDYTREEAENAIREAGGIPVHSVTKTTELLVAGDKGGSKLKKAEELGIEIIDDNHFKKLIKDNASPSTEPTPSSSYDVIRRDGAPAFKNAEGDLHFDGWVFVEDPNHGGELETSIEVVKKYGYKDQKIWKEGELSRFEERFEWKVGDPSENPEEYTNQLEAYKSQRFCDLCHCLYAKDPQGRELWNGEDTPFGKIGGDEFVCWWNGVRFEMLAECIINSWCDG